MAGPHAVTVNFFDPTDPQGEVIGVPHALGVNIAECRDSLRLKLLECRPGQRLDPTARGRWLVPSLHVDTNNEGTYRCVTVIVYLNDVPEGHGGETRFPLAGAATGSALRKASEAALASGATALFRQQPPGAAEPEDGSPTHGTLGGGDAAAPMLGAAESADCALRVRPQRGQAIVFWTLTSEGLDPNSWHSGARVLYGGGGKWIAQKFKELPASHRRRKAGAYRLPDECAPPPMARPRGGDGPTVPID